MNKYKPLLFRPLLLIKNINKKNELAMLKNELNYIFVNYDIKKELKNELELMLNANYKNQESIQKLVCKLNLTEQTELGIEFEKKYKSLIHDIKFYNFALKRRIDNISEIVLRDKIWYENKVDKISKEVEEIEKIK